MTKENKKTKKVENNLTLQDWVDKLTTTIINLEEVLEYKIRHKTMNEDYYLILEAKRPRYSISDIKYYRNNVEIYSYVKDDVKNYKPSFIELSMNNWELVKEEWYDNVQK